MMRLFGTLACAGLLFSSALPVTAQEDLPTIRPTIQISENLVLGADLAEFEAWMADFRASVEGLIEAGDLPLADICAYEGFRVIGPREFDRRRIETEADGWETAEMSVYFLFDPLILEASYDIAGYLELAHGAEEAAARMEVWSRIVQDQSPLIVTDVSTEADMVTLSERCTG